MNVKNLDLIFENYISRFERINAPDGANENYKWFAVHNFQEAFDLEAPDFASMLKKACRSTENLIDSYMQPFGGLVAMAEKDGEAETIREMFRRLFADDKGRSERPAAKNHGVCFLLRRVARKTLSFQPSVQERPAFRDGVSLVLRSGS